MRRAFLFLAFVFACKRAPPPAPPFCDQDLTGVWLNSTDKHYAYRLRDHGGIVRGEFMERDDDGGLRNPDDPVLFELHRTDGGISGVMRAQGASPSGRVCPVEYGFDVTVCQPNALQAQVEMNVNITDECKRLKFEDGGEPAPDIREFRLERAQ